jgi:hypothetical protein
MAELKTLLCAVAVAAQIMTVTNVRAGDISPQRAAAGSGRSLDGSSSAVGNASGGEAEDQPPPYIPPTHGTAQTLILGSVALAGGVAAFLAANKKDETSTSTTTTSTTGTQ